MPTFKAAKVLQYKISSSDPMLLMVIMITLQHDCER